MCFCLFCDGELGKYQNFHGLIILILITFGMIDVLRKLNKESIVE